ncbi:MAG: ABC transporter ATP-binding protein [Anaerolineales bacterium]|nr:ABC transporter ATP-binding protein [Anaerolineales bacterium]
MSLLTLRDLTIAYQINGNFYPAVRDFALTLEPGQTYGLVGESGSGKSTVALALMRYLSEGGRITEGEILFEGLNLLTLTEEQMRPIWGKRLALVPQNPLSSLNPSLRIGEQLAETLRHHENLPHADAAARAVTLLDQVRVPDPRRVADSYPHQISGGMQQRVMIAMALSTEPALLVLDEPTTNLDVTTQAAILDLFKDLIHEHHTAALYVTHNLGVVARTCDRVAVLYAGELVEDATTVDLFHQPLHPYTQGLLDSVPQLGENKQTVTLQAIPGRIPSLQNRPTGCVFAPRCPLAIEICNERPPLYPIESGGDNLRFSRCHRWQEIATGEITARRTPAETAPFATSSERSDTLLHLDDVKVHFDTHRSLSDLLKGASAKVKAVDGVNLELKRGLTIGLVGESGSGKTTLARAIVGLVARTGGEIELFGASLPATLSARDLDTLRHLQYVFQNPDEALNPYLSLGETLRRPLITLLHKSREEADAEVTRLLRAVRLPADYAARLPGQLSGGEKQRVAIARAFATNPSLLIADEAVSALDVSVQASILNLLKDLQTDFGNTLLFISHDLAAVGYLADKIAVAYVGQLMEFANADDLFRSPYHPYTESLLSAIPIPDPEADQPAIRLEGDPPSQINVPSGCPFHPRCPRRVGEICATEIPPWHVTANGKRYFCHIPPETLEKIQGAVIQ